MNKENKISFLRELTQNLQKVGFTAVPETEDGLLPVDLDGQRLCTVMESGAVRYRKEAADDEGMIEALDRVIDIAKVTREYVDHLEAAPPLTAEGLKGDYRLLAEFNSMVLAGHPTQYGIQFITWWRGADPSSLYHGSYYGPGWGDRCYLAAKRRFAIHSGLIPRSAIFTPEQQAEIYRGIQETLENEDPLAEERQKRLESIAEQIEQNVPDLAEWHALFNRMEAAPENAESPQIGGMQFS